MHTASAGEPEENSSEQGREPTTKSTHMWRRVRESNLPHSGGRQAPSLHLCHAIFISCPAMTAALCQIINTHGLIKSKYTELYYICSEAFRTCIYFPCINFCEGFCTYIPTQMQYSSHYFIRRNFLVCQISNRQINLKNVQLNNSFDFQAMMLPRARVIHETPSATCSDRDY